MKLSPSGKKDFLISLPSWRWERNQEGSLIREMSLPVNEGSIKLRRKDGHELTNNKGLYNVRPHAWNNSIESVSKMSSTEDRPLVEWINLIVRINEEMNDKWPILEEKYLSLNYWQVNN